jgi:hypothetical protein
MDELFIFIYIYFVFPIQNSKDRHGKTLKPSIKIVQRIFYSFVSEIILHLLSPFFSFLNIRQQKELIHNGMVQVK